MLFHKLPPRICCTGTPSLVHPSCCQGPPRAVHVSDSWEQSCWALSRLPTLSSAERSGSKQKALSIASWGPPGTGTAAGTRASHSSGFPPGRNVSISKVPMNQDLFVCVFFNRAEIMAHFFPEAAYVHQNLSSHQLKMLFFTDCSLTTKLQLVPTGARVCSPAALQELHVPFRHQRHQGWQAPRQNKHTGLHSPMAQVYQSHVLTLLGAAIMES